MNVLNACWGLRLVRSVLLVRVSIQECLLALLIVSFSHPLNSLNADSKSKKKIEHELIIRDPLIALGKL